jgi:acyl-CoA dehydrogenase
MTSLDPSPEPDLLHRAIRIANQVAGRHAAQVDRGAIFPADAVAALRRAGLMSMMLPTDVGGRNSSLHDLAQVTDVLARRCASTALIFAMHQIQVACLLRHARHPILRQLLHDVSRRQLLLGSATSERGTDGDIRISRCALQQHGDDVLIEKEASVVSYATEADAILATARRSADGGSRDQVLLACRRPRMRLQQRKATEMLGMRGTRSLPYRLVARAPAGAVFEEPFERILATTMLPTSHVLWGAAWVGLASAALAKAARYVQASARRSVGSTPVTAERLARVSATRQTMRALLQNMIQIVEQTDDEGRLTPDFVVQSNNLKVSLSSMAVEVVSGALLVTGVAGYRDDGEYALGRLLRDTYGGLVMVNNDRLTAVTAQLLLAVRSW